MGTLRFFAIQWAHGPQKRRLLSRLCRKKTTTLIHPFKSTVPQASSALFILVYEKQEEKEEQQNIASIMWNHLGV